MKAETLERLVRARAEKRPVALVTDLGTGLQTLVYPEAVHGSFSLDGAMLATVRDYLRADRSGVIQSDDDSRLFVQAVCPRLRLIVVGAVHIAQPLAPMAMLAGYDVTVVDPRRAFATDERFPGITVDQGWPDEALAALAPDARTAVVTLTHDQKLDDPALTVALHSGAFYIGALGSRKTHAARLGRLRAAGFAEPALARIHGPVGLGIGALTPAEIAVSILADITLALRQGTTV
ncbi:MAG: xanthine dehydrogenase [Azospirillum sp.]|nr:xanthine dehydrogenase [Azospirillum sp.]